jgi:hypothetical protein
VASSVQKTLPVTGTEVASVLKGGALVGVLTQSYQQKRLGCDVTVGPHHQELGMSIGSSCLDCCNGSQASQRKKLQKGNPAVCGSFHSCVWPGENGDRDNRTWLT